MLRCGVEPLPPTTDRCVTADDGAGTSVDWVTVPGDEATVLGRVVSVLRRV